MANFNIYGLAKDTRHDIYDLTGITVGTQVKIQNKGAGIVYVSDQATPPNVTDGTMLSDCTLLAQNDAGDTALTVYSTAPVNLLITEVI